MGNLEFFGLVIGGMAVLVVQLWVIVELFCFVFGWMWRDGSDGDKPGRPRRAKPGPPAGEKSQFSLRR